ncbi:MAG TPA: VTT domain-containing protein [Labilithrix sp.]|nr:VTT domain-containing protein [Labilithrix sp.]
MEREAKYEGAFAALRLVMSFAVLIGAVSFVGWAFRTELSRFGAWFVDRFGFVGMAGGAFLADGFHFPIPPQFYLLTGIAGGYPVESVILAVLVGSELGGLTAFLLARTLGRTRIVTRRLASTRELVTRLIVRQGYIGLAAATLLPISFSLLCITSGAMRLPYRAYGVLAVMRVPRILLSYFIIVAAWQR